MRWYFRGTFVGRSATYNYFLTYSNGMEKKKKKTIVFPTNWIKIKPKRFNKKQYVKRERYRR